MIYIIYGVQEELVKNRVNEIVKMHIGVPDGFNYVSYSGYDTSIEEIVRDAITLPFGIDKKVILVRHPYFFTGDKPAKLEFNFEEEVLLDYLKNPSESTILIFETIASKLSIPAKILKKLKEISQIEEIANILKDNWGLEIGKLLRTYKLTMDKDASTELLDRCGHDYQKIKNEIEKLSVYSNQITKLDVEALVARPLEDNTFQLTEKLVEKDIGGAIQLFRDLKLQQQEPVALISMVAKQVRFLYQVGMYSRQGLKEAEIAGELNAHPFRVKMALIRSRKMGNNELLFLLNELSRLDHTIKSGQADRFQAFELFLLKRIDPR